MSNEETKIEELCKIRGIGPETAKKLIEKGIESATQLASLRVEELSSILGVSYKKASELISNALSTQLTSIVELKTGKEIEEYRKNVIKKIPTSSKALDDMLDGGIQTDAITGITGELSTGKTQLCSQLAVNCMGILKRKVVWIETEPSTFSPERIQEIANKSNIQIDIGKDLFVIPARYISDPHSLFLAYMRIDDFIKQGNDVGLIIIDSFTAKFRQYYTRREQLGERSQEIAKHIGQLQVLASNYNLAVVITIQVGDVPDSNLQLTTQMKFGIKKRPSGGDTLFHGLTYWIALQQKKTNLWEAILFDAPNKPRQSAYFQILPEGIRDYMGK